MPLPSQESVEEPVEEPAPERREWSPRRLAQTLRRWKLQKSGRTYSQVALALHVTRRTLNNWQRGETIPDANELLALVVILGASLEDLSDVAK